VPEAVEHEAAPQQPTIRARLASDCDAGLPWSAGSASRDCDSIEGLLNPMPIASMPIAATSTRRSGHGNSGRATTITNCHEDQPVFADARHDLADADAWTSQDDADRRRDTRWWAHAGSATPQTARTSIQTTQGGHHQERHGQ
jgi:hypothetical protein